MVVSVQDLKKDFSGFEAIKGISFTIPRGEIFGLLGANGAGKTTAISILLGLITPSSGKIEVFGEDFEHHRVDILQRSNYMSAYANLPSNLSVQENLLIFAKLYGVANPKQRIRELAELLDIGDMLKRVTGELSSGQSTRVGLAKALLNRPELLLLDEPTASLDPDMADKVRKILQQVRRNDDMTMIYTSHNMRDVEELCDRIVFMSKGTILAEGTPAQITKTFGKKTLEEVFIKVSRDDH
jgi:ABC-2 type transport system ATP-binding protein